jgi:hypothetical protein
MDVVDRKRDIFSVDVESVGIKSRVDIEFKTQEDSRQSQPLGLNSVNSQPLVWRRGQTVW